MKDTNILIVGVGGQGTLLASVLLGKLAMEQGYDVKLSEVHGMAQRGGSVVTHVRMSEGTVTAPVISEGDADIIVAFEMLEAYRWVSYLKPGGVFIFSWDHPLMSCVDVIDDKLVFSGSYIKDEAFSYIQRGQPVTVQNRRMSAYINELADAGFVTERLIEETDSDTLSRAAEFSSGYYSPWRAQKLPLSFIIKARKL